MRLVDLLLDAGLISSKKHGQRLIEQGGVKVDGEVVTNIFYKVCGNFMVKIGKRVTAEFVDNVYQKPTPVVYEHTRHVSRQSSKAVLRVACAAVAEDYLKVHRKIANALLAFVCENTENLRSHLERKGLEVISVQVPHYLDGIADKGLYPGTFLTSFVEVDRGNTQEKVQ